MGSFPALHMGLIPGPVLHPGFLWTGESWMITANPWILQGLISPGDSPVPQR